MTEAQAALDGLPTRDRDEIFLELMATGTFNAMASNDSSGRLHDATGGFQAEHSIAPTGVLTPETRRAPRAVGTRIFNSWGFESLDHPFASASALVPGSFGLSRSPIQHGSSSEDRHRTMNVDFSFFAEGEATLSTIPDDLTRPAAGRRVDMRVIRPTSMSVAGGTDKTSNCSRHIVVRGGISGFTLCRDSDAFPNGARVAALMANALCPRHMVSDPGQQADTFEALPSAPDGSKAPAFPDAMAFSGSTPTNAGADRVGQDLLQANQDALRRAAQERADRRAKFQADQLSRRAEADRKAGAEQQASAADLCGRASERPTIVDACSAVIGLSTDQKPLERAYQVQRHGRRAGAGLQLRGS